MPNSSSRSALPSPRDLLTSIFNSLPQSLPPTESDLPNNASNNPLKALNATHRSLLVTLHVLFPSIFLQALDLLDRGLVTRVVQVTPSTGSEGHPPPPVPAPPQPHIHHHLPFTDPAQGERQPQRPKDKENTIYLVRSSQPAHARSTASSSRYSTTHPPPRSYVIRLSAWNCSCAAFAFSAFPASASVPFSGQLEDCASGLGSTPGPVAEASWQFGGLSSDGKGGNGLGEGRGGVPCCKHLMACVLAERWDGVLGVYVKTMRVGREEMAGLGADGGA